MLDENNSLNEIDANKAQQIYSDILNSNSPPSLAEIINKIIENNIILDNEKAEILRILIIKNKSITKDELIEGIKEIDIKDDFKKSEIIRAFINGNPKLIITQENVIDIINDLEIKNESAKSKIIQTFVANNDANLVEIIKDAEIENNAEKIYIVLVFIGHKKPSEVHHENIIEIIEELGIKDQDNKSKIVKAIFVNTWFLKSKGCEDLNLRDSENQNGGFVRNENNNFVLNENATAENFVKIIKDFGLQHPVLFTADLYKFTFGKNQEIDVENIVEIAQKLYPSEASQCQFIKNIIGFGYINQENVFHLKPLIEKLQDNALALDLIETLCEKEILIEEKDILSLVRNRIKKQYALLSAIADDLTINECVNEEGLELLKETFGDDFSVDKTPITVSDLISYFDIKNQNSVLSSILKPEFKQQLRDNFSPSVKVLLYKKQDLEKLNQLLSEEGVDFDIKDYFIESAKLCDYLKEEVGHIVEFDSSKTYQINFANFDFEVKFEDDDNEERRASKIESLESEKQELNDLFNKILKEENPEVEDIERFFNWILNSKIPLESNNENKLKKFFSKNKKEIIHCFCNEDLEKKDLEPLFTTLDDGCFSNIDMQFKKMIYGSIIKDENAQILYQFSDVKVFSSIINSGEDIMNDEFGPMDNCVIRSYYLLPIVLFENLVEENILNNQKSWEIIQKNLGTEERNRLYEKIFEEAKGDDVLVDEKAKKIASYLLINEVVGVDKMQDLESENPQLKMLGNLIYDRVSKLSPQPSARDNEEDFLINPSQEIMRQDSLDRRGFSLEFSSLDLRESSPQASPRKATCLPAFSCFSFLLAKR
jgi:hypothetical protein